MIKIYKVPPKGRSNVIEVPAVLMSHSVLGRIWKEIQDHIPELLNDICQREEKFLSHHRLVARKYCRGKLRRQVYLLLAIHMETPSIKARFENILEELMKSERDDFTGCENDRTDFAFEWGRTEGIQQQSFDQYGGEFKRREASRRFKSYIRL